MSARKDNTTPQELFSNGVKTIDARFTIKDAGHGMGDGLFATVPIKKGEFIMEYTGERLPTAIADERESRYLFEIDEDWTIDGSDKSNTARYINHSCDPNAEAEIVEEEGVPGGKIIISAVKNIRKGEEITFDYDQEYFDEYIKPIGCKCGAKVHRK